MVLEDIRSNKRQLRATGPPHEPKPRLFNRLATEPEARYKTFHHSGVWVSGHRYTKCKSLYLYTLHASDSTSHSGRDKRVC